MTFVAGFTLDLGAVEVTCQGTQAPIILFVNLVILGTTIIIILSEYLELQFTVLQEIFERNMYLITRVSFRKYMEENPRNWTSRKYFFELILASLFRCIISIESTHCVMQFLISCVQFHVFIFTPTGYHASSPQCDEALYYLDTTLAILSTMTLWLVFFPSVYMIAGVLTPKLIDIGIDIEPIVSLSNVDFVEKKALMTKGLKLFSLIAPDLYLFELIKLYMKRIVKMLFSKESEVTETPLNDLKRLLKRS